MNALRRMILPATLLGALALCGCNAEVSELKEKIGTMEKRLVKQEKMLVEFEKKFSVPKDFSVDIQRLEDQQEKVAELIKTKVEPVDKHLGEVQDWIQEAEADRRRVADKIKQMEQFHNQVGGVIEAVKREMERLGKELTDTSTKARLTAKAVQDQEKAINHLDRSVKSLESAFQSNNNQLLTAVKKTLPKVKDAAVAEMKVELEQLAKRVQPVQVGTDQDRKTPPEGLHPPIAAAPNKDDLKLLRERVKELGEIVEKQNADLLEVNTKVHDLQIRFRRQAATADDSAVTQAQPNRIERQPRRGQQ